MVRLNKASVTQGNLTAKTAQNANRNTQSRILLGLVVFGATICSLRFGASPLEQPLPGGILCPTAQVEEVKHGLPIMIDSTNATVMGFATGYGPRVFKNFVGSLRKSGFKGHIILGVAPDIAEESVKYLTSRQVTMAKVEFIPCTHGMFDDELKDEERDSHQKEARSCVAPYDKLKSRWGRFPFLRDQLKKCAGCTGPVLISDVRDTFFQLDPFGAGQPQVEGLHVFEEHKKQTTKHWLAEWPIRECRGVVYDKTMLCSGTTIGTRQSMIDYLDTMNQEMDHWMSDKKCHFKINGDDQSIHNYLYYSGKLPFAKAIPNGLGIVNTVGYMGSIIFNAHAKQMKAKGKEGSDAYEGTTRGTKPWITQEYDMTDEEGYFLDHDGKKSAAVHQYDRFGIPISAWLEQASGLVDPD